MSSDTTPRAAALLQKLMMARTPQERARMGAAMFDTPRAVALASIRQANPVLSETEERVLLFRRFYEADLTAEQVERFVDRIRAAGSKTRVDSHRSPAP